MPKVLPKSGVYLIRNKVNEKVYVGSSARSVLGRMKEHRTGLYKDKHYNRHLQAAWNKYGSDAFEFKTICRCEPEECIEIEQAWIDAYNSADGDFGYNLSPTAGSNLGLPCSEETKRKISKKAKGKQWTAESKAKLSATLKGHPCTEKALRAMNWTGRNHTAEAKAKLAEYGRNRSPETLAKMSASGHKKRLSPEHRAKIAAAGKGRKWTPEMRSKMVGQKRSAETRAKISAGQIGREVTVESRAKISAGLRKYYENKSNGSLCS